MQQPLFTDLMTRSRVGMLGLNGQGIITHAGAAAATLLGREAAALEGLDFFEQFCPDLEAVPEPSVDEWETWVIAGDPEQRLNCRISVFAAQSYAPIGYMVAIIDGSGWDRLCRERDRLMEMATISEVLPVVLHELKNPLASIQALVELMTEDCTDGTLQEQLHGILMEIRRMKLGFEGLGTSTRNLLSTRGQAVDYGIREACTIFERQLAARGIGFTSEIETMPLLCLDAGSIRGMLFNLLNNAMHACKSGNEIRVESGLGEDGRRFYLTVEDTGCGMPPEVLARCTTLFFTTKSMGSGIGLALCSEVVEKVGGRLDIQSTQGEGTRISMSIPLQHAKSVKGVNL